MVSKIQFSLIKKTDTSCELFFCKDLRFCESTPLVEPCNTNLIFNTKSVGNIEISTNYFSGLCNSIISVLGISKGSTMSWGGAQFIAVWMIVNQVGQIVCGPLELERLERVHGPIMRWKNYQTNHTLGPKSS